MPDADGRRPRRLKDQRRIPVNLRVTPRMRESLQSLAQHNGRSLSQQTEFLLEQALLLEGAPSREVEEIYRAPGPLSDELIGRLILLDAKIAGLQAALETGLDRNANVIGRLQSRLERRVAEFEAELASNTTETSTAVSNLQRVAAHLTGLLHDVEVVLRRTRAEAAARRQRSRLVSSTGGGETADG